MNAWTDGRTIRSDQQTFRELIVSWCVCCRVGRLSGSSGADNQRVCYCVKACSGRDVL